MAFKNEKQKEVGGPDESPPSFPRRPGFPSTALHVAEHCHAGG